MSSSEVVIYHNPACGTSNKVLAWLQEAGAQPRVVKYLETGWDRAELQALLARLDVTPRDVLRVRGTAAEALGLTNPQVRDEQIFEAMVRHPDLVERPIVVTPNGVRLCRPPERVAEVWGT